MYQIENPVDRASAMLGKAGESYGKMMPNIPEPGKSAGGAIESAAAGMGTGAQVGSMFAEAGAQGIAAVGGPVPLVVGAGVGLLSYLLS